MRIGRVESQDGYVDRVVALRSDGNADRSEIIGRDTFSKRVKWSVYQGSAVLFEKARMSGVMLRPFGTSGKFYIALVPSSVTSNVLQHGVSASGEKLVLRFLKLITLKAPK